MVQYSTRFVQ